jgi:purine catabolism regulator
LLSWIDSPGSAAAGTVTSTASRLLVDLQELVPGLRARCGVSGSHRGLRGVGACLEEARLAVLEAAATETVNRPVRSDVLGLRPVMLEWFASSQVRGALARVLEPFDGIEPRLRTKLLETLTVFLDTGCSPGRAAEQLGLHRNGLSYRLRQIEEILGVDLGRPDERLALHLACRARALFFTA